MKKEFASIPLSDVDVNLLERITGPLNSDVILLSDPPSTLIDLLNAACDDSVTFRDARLPMSSPVIVLNGVSKISSVQVNALNLL